MRIQSARESAGIQHLQSLGWRNARAVEREQGGSPGKGGATAMLHEFHKDGMIASIGLNSCFSEKTVSLAMQRTSQ